jgi:DNA polymerase elongation subunit (family B)
MATILSIEELEPTDDYVYDIETEAGTFQAGDGDLIIKNTDSCYIKFNVDKDKFKGEDYMKEHFRLAIECAKEITKTFKPPIELEFEKVMYPFMLFAKKRYSYLEWTKPEASNEIEHKGTQIVRRDNCPYVKEVFGDLMNCIMYDKDVPKAQEIATSAVKKLLNDKVDKKKLTISKGLNNNYKVDGCKVKWDDPRVKYPHVKIAQNLKKIDPMNHPKPPDRVPYVFVMNKNKKALQCDRVAHPDYLGKNKIDTMSYFNNQLQSPIDMIFELLIDNPEDIYKEEVIKKKNKNAGLQDIRNFFKF